MSTIKAFSDIGNSGHYECLSPITESLCLEIITLSGYSKHRLNSDKLEEYRHKKIEKEIALISEHKKTYHDFDTVNRANKTIHYLKLLLENPDVIFR